ncbi:unnamed protein product, partial [Brassica rapa subsp. trilocularis]
MFVGFNIKSPKPSIVVSQNDAILVTIAETDADFSLLSGYGQRPASELHNLLPEVPVSDDSATVLSLQITLFPDQGFSIGVAAHHGVSDGKTSTMFVKAWAHVCKQHLEENNVIFSLPETLTPSLDRSLIKDTTGLDEQMLKIVRSMKQDKTNVSRSLSPIPAWELGDDFFFSTLVLSRGDVERLRERVKTTSSPPSQLHLSTFVIAYAYVWTCLVKARGGNMERPVSFLFVADFRERLDPPLPPTYFGNCIYGQRPAFELHALIPELPVSDDSAKILSLQITLFPDHGFSIGVSAHHGVLDGKMSTMFVKAWAHLCKQHLEETTVLFSLPETLTPSLDRSLIKDTTGLDEQMINIVRSLKQGKLIGSRSLNSTPASERGDDVVFATLVLSRGDVERLRERVKNESPDPSQLHLSTFVISYAYMWTCLVKARGGNMERSVSFLFVGDFRERLDPPLPATYFGNCMFPAGSYDNTAAEFAGDGVVAPLPETLTPSLDRSLIKDTTGLDEQMIKIVRSLNDDGRIVGRRRNLSSIPAWERGDDGVFATLVLSRGDVERLRERVENESSSPSELLHLSTLVVAYAYVWTCLVKARGGDMERPVSLLFVADFRERLDPPLPATYFGNCMFPAGCFNSKTAGDFAGEGG